MGNSPYLLGKESDYYVDTKRAITNPTILSKVAEIISNKFYCTEYRQN